MKTIKRFQHYNEEKYLYPKTFDRWRLWVKHRKLMKYWLNFCNTRAGPYGALHRAFSKWKRGEAEKQKQLHELSREDLENKNINLQNDLAVMRDHEQEVEAKKAHIDQQVSELQAHQVRAKVLGLSSTFKMLKTDLLHAFQRWVQVHKGNSHLEKQQRLKDNLNKILQLKGRLARTEMDNSGLAEENEELRQFALDGMEMAKSAADLAGKGNDLSVDLADKSDSIKKLLDENERLTQRLDAA